RREYLSMGSVMVNATRLMQTAGDEILCDEATVLAASTRYRFSEPGSVHIKGRTEPLAVHRIEQPSRPHHRIPGVPGVIFGRHEELESLTDRVRRIPDDGGGLALIEGEPGAGKSHLLIHVAEAARRFRYRLFMAVTSSIEQSTPYYVFREILPQLLLGPSDPS